MHLVQELSLRNRDMLDRWMAHHLAQLIDEATTQKNPRHRERARRRASELALKIWDRRSSLAATANPLVYYEPALKMLISLQNPTNPFFPSRSDRQDLARRLYDNLNALTKFLIQIELPRRSGRARPGADSPGAKFLPKKEKDLLHKLDELLGAIDSDELHDLKRRAERANDPYLHLEDLIEDTSAALTDLRKKIRRDKSETGASRA
jgi:hypothetical protein